jgi:DNA invertase Pin-like site-specific DNA recombinase
MLDELRDGNVVRVAKYVRFTRTLRDLFDFAKSIKERGARFQSLAEDIDTTSSAGGLIFYVFASIVHFECRRTAERTREGLAAACNRIRFASHSNRSSQTRHALGLHPDHFIGTGHSHESRAP